jgi:EAL domain-containing protein (putative c-di-GMP-specific phosphodiesterase class I)
VVTNDIETLQQAKRLREIDCHYVKGYFFSHPQRESVWQEQLQSLKTAL